MNQSAHPARMHLSRNALLGLALGLAVALAAMRAVGTLGPAGLRWLLPIGFIIMTAIPWLLLTKPGRQRIGLQRAVKPHFYLLALCGGVSAAMLCFALGFMLYGTSQDNWFVSVADSYRRTMNTTGFELLTLHLVFTLPACIFSPIGEELFFRGFLQRALETRFSSRQSTHLEAGFFGLVHLCHHGLIASAAGISLMAGSGAIWVVLMYGAAWMFAWLRQRSDSLLPAVLAHAAFNATMNVFIFSMLWAPV